MVLSRMRRAWGWYQQQLVNKPVRTQVVTSTLLWAAGDAVAQQVDIAMSLRQQRRGSTLTSAHLPHRGVTSSAREEGEKHPRLNLSTGVPSCGADESGPSKSESRPRLELARICTTGLFGAGFVGPCGHFWYAGLEHFVKNTMHLRPKSTPFIVSKIALDTFIFGPVHLIAFFTWTGMASGHSYGRIKKDVARDFIPAFLTEATVWPLIQYGNFRFVPVQHQLLFVNVCCLLDSAWLSWLKYQQDAPWKLALLKLVSFDSPSN